MTEDVKTRLMNLRVLPGEQEGWKSEAERAGLSLSAWVRMVCNARSGPAPSRPKLDTSALDEQAFPQLEALVKAGKVQRGSSGVKKRSGVCVHRVPAGSWCKRCEEG